jgi:hypothetical protein
MKQSRDIRASASVAACFFADRNVSSNNTADAMHQAEFREVFSFLIFVFTVNVIS